MRQEYAVLAINAFAMLQALSIVSGNIHRVVQETKANILSGTLTLQSFRRKMNELVFVDCLDRQCQEILEKGLLLGTFTASANTIQSFSLSRSVDYVVNKDRTLALYPDFVEDMIKGVTEEIWKTYNVRIPKSKVYFGQSMLPLSRETIMKNVCPSGLKRGGEYDEDYQSEKSDFLLRQFRAIQELQNKKPEEQREIFQSTCLYMRIFTSCLMHEQVPLETNGRCLWSGQPSKRLVSCTICGGRISATNFDNFHRHKDFPAENRLTDSASTAPGSDVSSGTMNRDVSPIAVKSFSFLSP